MSLKIGYAVVVVGMAVSVPAYASGVPYTDAPSTGQILQQLSPRAPFLKAPQPTITLPAPALQKSNSTIPIPVKKIIVLGDTVLPNSMIDREIKPLEGRTITLGQLQQVAENLTNDLHARGYVVSYAYIPAQSVEDGIVHIQFVETRYDQIHITPSRLDTSMAYRTLGQSAGSIIENNSLNRGLLLLNQTPGVRVAGTLVPGAVTGTSNLNVDVHDRPTITGSAAVNNYGSNYTGRLQWLGNVALRNPFGYGGEIAANGVTSSGGLLHGAGLSMLSPNIWDGLRASIFGSWTHYRLGESFYDLDQHGQAIQWGGGLSYPVLLEPGEQINASLNFIQDRFSQETGTDTNSTSRSRLNLIQWGLNGALADGGGYTSFSVNATWGNKQIFGLAAQESDADGPDTAGTFWTGQFQLQRIQSLPAQFRLNAQLYGQVASKNLDASQQLYLGGPTGVMSYDIGTGAGDQGILARLSLSHRLPVPMPGHLRAAVLLQGGEVWQYHNYYLGAPTHNRLGMAGAGLGLSYDWKQCIRLSVDWVHRLGNTINTGGANQNSQIWAQLTVTPSVLFKKEV